MRTTLLRGLLRSAPLPLRGAFLAGRPLAFLRVLGQGEQGDLAFGERHRLLERHGLDLLQRVEAAPAGRPATCPAMRRSSRSSRPSRSSSTWFTRPMSSACAACQRLAGEAQLGQLAPWQQALQAPTSTWAGNTPTFTSGRPNTAWRRGHRQVAHGQQAHAAGHAGAVDARDKGTWQARCAAAGPGADRLGEVGGSGRLQVGAGAERLAAGPGRARWQRQPRSPAQRQARCRPAPRGSGVAAFLASGSSATARAAALPQFRVSWRSPSGLIPGAAGRPVLLTQAQALPLRC